MAKQDFCFTYYDGDAARDKAHMTRLCRGAYDDFISMQRKAGHLDLDTVKMVLSSDFESCWPSLKFILKTDSDGKYFIEWVDKSVEKMAKNAAMQKEKIESYWDDVKKGKIQRNGKSDTMVQKKEETVKPLENGDGDGNEDKNEIQEGGAGETTPESIIGQMISTWQDAGFYFSESPDEMLNLRLLAQNISKTKGLEHITPEKEKLLQAEFKSLTAWLKDGNRAEYYGTFKSLNSGGYAKFKNSGQKNRVGAEIIRGTDKYNEAAKKYSV